MARHVGFSYWAETPVGRGFDTFKGFFSGSEDHWTQVRDTALTTTQHTRNTVNTHSVSHLTREHWTQAYNTCSAGECPAQISYPSPWMAAAGLSGSCSHRAVLTHFSDPAQNHCIVFLRGGRAHHDSHGRWLQAITSICGAPIGRVTARTAQSLSWAGTDRCIIL